MPFSLSQQDVLYAAVLALIFTWLINSVSKVFKVVITRSTEFNFNPKYAEAVMRKCCRLFPNESVRFGGKTFTRGMPVQVVTSQKKTIEGQLIGSTDDNMVCFVTKCTVVAQEMDQIECMQVK